jgi:hypothetical protein
MVSWWYQNDKDQDVVVFIIQRQKGFTQSLPTSSLIQLIKLRAIIEGPYGKEIHLDEYGTVLLFATGIGIAGQLPYMRQLLGNFHKYNAKARRIALFWQVESEGEQSQICGDLANSQPEEHLQWVRQWMTEMLEQDTKYVSLIKTIFEASLIRFLIDPRYTSLCH